MRTNFNMQDQYITMVRGDTVSFGVEIEDQDGLPFDINTAFFSCKKNCDDKEYVFQKSIDHGITKAADGIYIVRIAPEDTQFIDVGKYFYDLQVGAIDDVYTILRGVLEIEQNVTD